MDSNLSNSSVPPESSTLRGPRGIVSSSFSRDLATGRGLVGKHFVLLSNEQGSSTLGPTPVHAIPQISYISAREAINRQTRDSGPAVCQAPIGMPISAYIAQPISLAVGADLPLVDLPSVAGKHDANGASRAAAKFSAQLRRAADTSER